MNSFVLFYLQSLLCCNIKLCRVSIFHHIYNYNNKGKNTKKNIANAKDEQKSSLGTIMAAEQFSMTEQFYCHLSLSSSSLAFFP